MTDEPQRDLPAWAQNMVPLDMAQAARVLGVARRTLVDIVRDHPHYERRGVKKVFYPEHIAMLRESLSREPAQSRPSIYPFENSSFCGIPLDPTSDSAFDEAMRLAQESKRKKPKSRRRGPNPD